MDKDNENIVTRRVFIKKNQTRKVLNYCLMLKLKITEIQKFTLKIKKKGYIF